MCLISVGPLPSEEILRDAAFGNPDGIGLAWREPTHVEYRKGLSVEDLLALPTRIKENCAVHFRLATAGGEKRELIHPFVVSKKSELSMSGKADRVFMHNGHVFSWENAHKGFGRKAPRGPMSDSRLMAYMVWRYGADILYSFPGNRFLVMSKKKTRLIGDWVRDEKTGIVYSNSTYKSPRITYIDGYYGSGKWARDEYGCADYTGYSGSNSYKDKDYTYRKNRKGVWEKVKYEYNSLVAAIESSKQALLPAPINPEEVRRFDSEVSAALRDPSRLPIDDDEKVS